MSIPERHDGLVYTRFISDLMQKRSCRTYLEIGVENGYCLSQMRVDNAIGIDPSFQITTDPTVGKANLSLHRMSSDEYFRDVKGRLAVDLAFLDGLHVFEYLLRDFYNVERHCNVGGLIAIHDALPTDELMISRVNTGTAWTGDIWKIVPILEKYRPDLEVSLVDCAPTGLVVVGNLDPASDVLKNNYARIVREFACKPNDKEALVQYYATRSILSTSVILNEFDHTLYFGL